MGKNKVGNPYGGNRGLHVRRGHVGQGSGNNPHKNVQHQQGAVPSKRAQLVPKETYFQAGLRYGWTGAKLLGRETFKVASLSASTLLGEWAFCRSDIPLPKGNLMPNFFALKPEGFQFTGFWAGATLGSKLTDSMPGNLGSAYAWLGSRTLPSFMNALSLMAVFTTRLAADFISSAGSAHFSSVIDYGTDGTKRLMKYVVMDEKIGLKRIFWATKIVSVLVSHLHEMPTLCKSIWNRTVTKGQAIAKFAQCSFELLQSIFVTKTYAEGILIYKQKAGEVGRYGYLVDGLTIGNWMIASFAAGGAKLAGSWNDAEFEGQSLPRYAMNCLGFNFIADQITGGVSLMLTATGTMCASSVYDDGSYDITEFSFACQYYLMAVMVSAYVNPLVKYLYAKSFYAAEGVKAKAA